MLPLFKRSENNEQIHNPFHGQGGPLNVTYPRHDSPISQMFLQAAELVAKADGRVVPAERDSLALFRDLLRD